jgi:hypothetical protein
VPPSLLRFDGIAPKPEAKAEKRRFGAAAAGVRDVLIVDRGYFRSDLVSVVADGLDRAAFLGLFALRLFLRGTRLFIDKGITAIVIAFEIVWRRFATQVAVDALVIDVELSRDVLRVLVCDVSHNSRR